MANKKFDVVVIGGGPGGYVAAIRASQLGLKAAVVERENMGGVCLNWGCIPTKALLRTAEVYHSFTQAENYGLKAEAISFDLDKVIGRSRDVAARLSSGIDHLMKKNKAEVFSASGKMGKRIDDAWQIILDSGEVIEAPSVILATGARARHLPGIEPDGEKVVTYRDAMTPKTMPKSLIIVGSGAIGIEFASFYRDMGVEVTVVEMEERILPVEDAEISALAEKIFVGRGITFHCSAKVTGVKKTKKGVTVTLDIGGKTPSLTAERMILAAGIAANIEDLGLETLKVEIERGHVVTDKHCRANDQGLYAIGDMTGAPWLAHKASHEGIIAAEHIAGLSDTHTLHVENIPGCTYCRPQIASVGLTEQAAIEAGYQVKVGRFPFVGNGKAIALGDDEGMIKTIFDEKTGALLGAHMIGAEVTELIQGFAIARTLETTEAELMQTIFPHPTLSEAMHESVLDAFGRAIHF